MNNYEYPSERLWMKERSGTFVDVYECSFGKFFLGHVFSCHTFFLIRSYYFFVAVLRKKITFFFSLGHGFFLRHNENICFNKTKKLKYYFFTFYLNLYFRDKKRKIKFIANETVNCKKKMWIYVDFINLIYNTMYIHSKRIITEL